MGMAASVAFTVVLADRRTGMGDLGSINDGTSKRPSWEKGEMGYESPVLQARTGASNRPSGRFCCLRRGCFLSVLDSNDSS